VSSEAPEKPDAEAAEDLKSSLKECLAGMPSGPIPPECVAQFEAVMLKLRP
jgi:hypothetical protein